MLPEPGWCLQLQLLACRGIALHAHDEPASPHQAPMTNPQVQAAPQHPLGSPPSADAQAASPRFKVQRSIFKGPASEADSGGIVRGSQPLDVRWPEAEPLSEGAEARISDRMSAILGWEDDSSQDPSEGSVRGGVRGFGAEEASLATKRFSRDTIAVSRDAIAPAPTSRGNNALHSVGPHPQPLNLFSGFVSHDQLADAIGDGQGGRRRNQEQHVVRMRGPGETLFARIS